LHESIHIWMKKTCIPILFLVAFLLLTGCTSPTSNSGNSTQGTPAFSVTDLKGGSNFIAGQDIIITGSGFGDSLRTPNGGLNSVSFMPRSSGSSPVNSIGYASWSDTRIQCTIPIINTASGSYLVQVNLVTPTSVTNLEAPSTISITSFEGPVITSINPLTVNQGGNVTIFGDNFGPEIDDTYESAQDGGSVQFWTPPKFVNYVSQDKTTIWTRTMVICRVPASVPTGQAEVAVVTGTNLTSIHYAMNIVGPADPTISTITPSTLDVGATTPITITGTNFGKNSGAGTVIFQPVKGMPVTINSVTSWNDTKIVCPTVPAITAGEGTVSVTVVPAGRNSTNSYGIVIANVGSLLHGPRLGLITQKTATISWDTRDTETGEVQWGTSTAYTQSQKENASTPYHRLMVQGLSPSTTYHYAVVAGGQTAADHTFTTAPPDGTGTFTFATMADNRGHSDQADLQSISPAFLNILNQVAKQKPAFALHAGDIFYGNTQSTVVYQLYDSFKSGTDPFAGDISILFSPGNHEMQELTDPEGNTVDPLALFNQEFAQPDQLAGHEGTTYSFDWGNSHFVSVDSCHYNRSSPYQGMAYVDDEIIAWLDGDLKSAQDRKVRHIFVFSHANAFSKWSLYFQGSVDPAQRDKLWNILTKYKVDAYICGHDHTFNDKLGTNGIVQWLNGNSGSISPGEGPNEFTIWHVNGDVVEAELLDENGQITYKRTIQSSQPK